MLSISRHVPARTKTLKASWCKLDFMEMSDKYRKIRSKCKRKMDACYWCKHEFENGEMMALACFEKVGNRTLCRGCAKELLGVRELEKDRQGGRKE